MQTLILFGLVWEAWAYTMWVTNWLDPELVPVRAMLFATALISLVLSLAIPDAFSTRGWAVAIAYAVMQVGRTAFVIAVLRADPGLRRNFQRILCWCLVSATFALVGAAVDGHGPRGAVGRRGRRRFPRRHGRLLGCGSRSLVHDGVDGRRWSYRRAVSCVRPHRPGGIGGRSRRDVVGPAPHRGQRGAGVRLRLPGVVGLWWIYFARAAEGAAEVITTASDPGRYARAYHEVHPLMIGGIIVIAAADELVLRHPLHATAATTWTVLGGTVLFIGGHAIFKAYLWRERPWSRIAAVVISIALLPVAAHLAPLALAACALAVTVGVAVSDAVTQR